MKIDYLGHVIQRKELKLPDATAATARAVEDHTSQTGLRSFLVLCNIYSQFRRELLMISSTVEYEITERLVHLISLPYSGLDVCNGEPGEVTETFANSSASKSNGPVHSLHLRARLRSGMCVTSSTGRRHLSAN